MALGMALKRFAVISIDATPQICGQLVYAANLSVFRVNR
jgi:hypothetical protein